jgi:hypothetical protein
MYINANRYSPANRQDIDHPSLFKEGTRVVKITRWGEVGI